MKIMKKLKKISRDDLKTVIGGKACSQWVGITAFCGAPILYVQTIIRIGQNYKKL